MDDPSMALDLANTAVGRGSDPLAGPGTFLRWLAEREGALGSPDEELALRAAEFRELRAVVDELLSAAVAGERLPASAVGRLNGAAAASPWAVRLEIGEDGAPRRAEMVTAAGRAAGMMAAVARSAIDVLGGRDRERLRVCRAPSCGRFFLAGRPRQVWCSGACGNRARVARHHARRRAGS